MTFNSALYLFCLGCMCTWICLITVVKCVEKDEEQFLSENSEEVVYVPRLNFSRAWIPKCCNLSYEYSSENRSQCVKTNSEFLPDLEDIPNYLQTAKTLPAIARYEYFIGDPCSEGKYILDMENYPDDNYTLYSNGTLLYLDRLYETDEFCIETVDGELKVFMCFETAELHYESDFKYVVYATGLLISIIFLVATGVIYLSVDMFRDLRGKSLACHVFLLAIGYLVLAIVQLATDELPMDVCIGAGFVIQFVFVAAFFWLNVICFDTWRCIKLDFRSVKSSIINPASCQKDKKKEKKMFCLYCVYAWYGPFMLSIASLVMDRTPAIPDSYLKPNFGLGSCWFNTDDAALPYFYGPIGTLILINIILFLLSVRKIYLAEKEHLKKMNENKVTEDETRDIRVKISIYLRTLHESIWLFGVMGINWAAEVISWAVGSAQIIWMIADVFNTLQGIVIFYLFVVRPKPVRTELKRKLKRIWQRITCSRNERKENCSRLHHHLDESLSNESEEPKSKNENCELLVKGTFV